MECYSLSQTAVQVQLISVSTSAGKPADFLEYHFPFLTFNKQRQIADHGQFRAPEPSFVLYLNVRKTAVAPKKKKS
jgi:hypothetical protein